jgi:hypothetical protein
MVSDIKGETQTESDRLSVLQNKMLRTFGQNRDEVMGGLRKLHKNELRDLHSSAIIIRIIKSRRLGWIWHIA